MFTVHIRQYCTVDSVAGVCYNADSGKGPFYRPIPGKDGEIMAISDAKRKANAKWDSENMATLACKVKKEQATQFRAYCSAKGETVNAVLQGYVLSCVGEAPETPQNARQGPGYNLTPSAIKTAQDAAEKAGETVPAFVERAVETQAKRDNSARRLLRPKEKAPDESGT